MTSLPVSCHFRQYNDVISGHVREKCRKPTGKWSMTSLPVVCHKGCDVTSGSQVHG